MSVSEADLLPAYVAALSALAVGVLAAAVAVRNEQSRHRAEREAVHGQEIRNRTADAFSLMFVVQHEIEWITWYAARNSAALDQEMVDRYNNAIHAAYPRLLGSMAVVCALDEPLYNRLKPLADELYKLDTDVALGARGLEGSFRASSVELLKSLYPEAHSLHLRLPGEMAKAMRNE